MTKHTQITLLLLRIVLGGLFLYSGLDKLLSDFTAAGYLQNAVTGPFAGFFMPLAGLAIVDLLVVWGEILIGTALILGVFVTPAAIFGSLMMILFYLSVQPQEHGPISEHIVYIFALAAVASIKHKRLFGLKIPILATQSED